MNKEKKIFAGILLLFLGAFAWIMLSPKEEPIGNLAKDGHAYSSALTYATTSLTNNVAARLLVRATSSRSTARVCNVDGAERVWTYKQSTSTGIVANQGFPIYATSGTAWPQIPNCLLIDQNDPYLGEIWAIVSATTTVSVESLQN